MADPERPLIPLPRAEQVPPRPPPPPPRGGPKGPRKARQIERLSPKFERLKTSLEEKRAALEADPEGVAPEQVLVLETNGPAKELLDAVKATPGLAWLAEEGLYDVVPDEDFFIPEAPKKLLTARLYMILTDQAALAQLLSLWSLWTRNRRLPKEFRSWNHVLRKLRDLRRWGVADRLRETGIAEDWELRKQHGGARGAPVEIELWFRSPEQRELAAQRVTALVRAAQGQVLAASTIADIHYHAILASLPTAAVEHLLHDDSVQLVKADDVRLFRPVPQASIMPSGEAPNEDAPERGAAGPLLDPVVALLDGLPLENHALLAERLTVDDPDDWSPTYPVDRRFHGTAMAALIIHGDLSSSSAPLRNRLYVRPILRLDTWGRERAPEDELWVDLVHRAVRRAVVGEGGAPPSSPGVQIVNLSVGDLFQPFVDSALSPLARLLDWLAWEHNLLFVVSAGNHIDDIQVDGNAQGPRLEDGVLLALQASHRHRRLLSPAESINAITVGALHHDDSGPVAARYPEEMVLLSTDGMPAPFSALGRGFRRSVKPDLLAPGGRTLYARALGSDPSRPFVLVQRPLEPPGSKVAAPVRRGTRYQAGTSNAAALTTRAAVQILEAIRSLQVNAPELQAVPPALLVKALLVHTAEWPRSATEVFERTLKNDSNKSVFKDYLSAFLGYGVLRTDRALGCTADRATLVGGDTIGEGETRLHRIPLPAALNAFTGRRRLTITLAWFSPINPNSRAYRCAALAFVPPIDGRTPLRVSRADVDLRAGLRGTVQHAVLERDSGAINVTEGETIEIPVTCLFESRGGLGFRVPYALAVTVEVAPGLSVSVYDSIRDIVRARVPIRQ